MGGGRDHGRDRCVIIMDTPFGKQASRTRSWSWIIWEERACMTQDDAFDAHDAFDTLAVDAAKHWHNFASNWNKGNCEQFFFPYKIFSLTKICYFFLILHNFAILLINICSTHFVKQFWSKMLKNVIKRGSLQYNVDTMKKFSIVVQNSVGNLHDDA